MTKAFFLGIPALVVACGGDARDSFTNACVNIIHCDDDTSGVSEDAITARCEQDTEQEAGNAEEAGCAEPFDQLAVCLERNTDTCEHARDLDEACEEEEDALRSCRRK